VKLVTRLLPYLLMLVPFWGIYSQMSTAFQNQGCQMNLTLGGADIPISALNCFDTFSILLLVPVFDQVIYPYLKKINRPLSMLQKIGWGFVLAMVAMGVAALVEHVRLQYAPTPGGYEDESARNNISPCQDIDDYNPNQYQQWWQGDDVDQPLYCSQTCDTTHTEGNKQYLDDECIDCKDIPQMSSMSVMWQAVQFALIGASEILAAITSLEFFYSQAPMAMRSVSQSLNLFTNALGSFLVIPILLLVNVNPKSQWVPNNLDNGHLDYYFLLLACMMGLNLMVFCYVAQSYEYKTTAELAILEDDSDLHPLKNPLSTEDPNSAHGLIGHEDPVLSAIHDSGRGGGRGYKAPEIGTSNGDSY